MPYADEDENSDAYKFPEFGQPDAADLDDAEELHTVTCPKCGKQVYEEAERCHKCGHWIERQHHASLPLWVIITALACLLMALIYTFWWGGGLYGR